jgi:hypothetical protein
MPLQTLVDPWTNIEYLLKCLSRIHLMKVVAAVRARKAESLLLPPDVSPLLQVMLIVDRKRDAMTTDNVSNAVSLLISRYGAPVSLGRYHLVENTSLELGVG